MEQESNKIELIKEWEGNKIGKIVRGDLWKLRELIKDGFAVWYHGFLNDGENAATQRAHDEKMTVIMQGKKEKKEEKKKEVVAEKATGKKLIGEK
jgi:hypothetical protein